jgi:hypothetical protein
LKTVDTSSAQMAIVSCLTYASSCYLHFLILLLFTNSNLAQTVGHIRNASLRASIIETRFNASNCIACVCAMLTWSSNSTILSTNCQQGVAAAAVECELFSNTTYQHSTWLYLEDNVNSTFYFRELPPGETSATTTLPSNLGEFNLLSETREGSSLHLSRE